MLDSLRSAAGTWVAKLLLLLLVVSFAIWGISGQITQGFGGSSVITAGGTKVTPIEYRLAFDRQIQILSQQFGSRITLDQAKAFGIDQQVLQQLVAGALLDEQARNLRLGLSQDKLAQLTMEDPAFRGPGGNFDRQQFEYALRNIGMRPEDYLRNRAQVAVRQQIVEAVSDGLKMPATFLKAVALYRGEDRTVEYIALPKSLVEPIENPSDAVLSAWFEENKKTYTAPEYRKVNYVRLLPADIADESAVTEDQVKAEYEKNIARFTTPETRTIEQIVFKDEASAQKALDTLMTGGTFDSIATAEGKTSADTLLGTFPKARVPDPAVAEAAFALQPNVVSGIVKGAFGPILLRVTAITPELVRTLPEVTPEIRKDLALAEANRILLDVHDAYEDARAGGDSMVDAAKKVNLKVTTIEAIDRSAQRPDGTVVNDLPDSANLMAAIFESDAGIENPGLTIPGNGYTFYEVESVTPARDRTVDEVKDRVIADWKKAETTKRLNAKAAELEKSVKDGKTLDAVATEIGLEKQTKRGLKRESNDSEFGQAGVQTVFGLTEGGTGLVPLESGEAQLLFKVTEVFEPAGADAASIPDESQKQFATGLSDDLLDQLVARLQTQYTVTINQTAIDQALATQ